MTKNTYQITIVEHEDFSLSCAATINGEQPDNETLGHLIAEEFSIGATFFYKLWKFLQQMKGEVDRVGGLLKEHGGDQEKVMAILMGQEGVE